MRSRLTALALLLVLARGLRSSRRKTLVKANPASFADRLISLQNHEVSVFTLGQQHFKGLLTSVTPGFITVLQRNDPPRAVFVPIVMISAVSIPSS